MSSPIDRLKKIFVWIIIGRCQFLFCVLIDLIFLIFWKTLRVKEHGGRKQAGNPRLVTTDYNHAAGDILKRIIVFGNRIFHPFPPRKPTCISHHFHLYRLFLFFFLFPFLFFFFVSTGEGQAGPQRAEHGATAPSWHPKLEGWTSGVKKRGHTQWSRRTR